MRVLPTSTYALAVAIPAALAAVYAPASSELRSAGLALTALLALTPFVPLPPRARALLALAMLIYAARGEAPLRPNKASSPETAEFADENVGIFRLVGVIARIDPDEVSGTTSGSLIDDRLHSIEFRIEGDAPRMRVQERWSMLARRMPSRPLWNFDRPPPTSPLARVVCSAASMQRERASDFVFAVTEDVRAELTRRIDQLFPAAQRGLTQALLLGHARAIESAQRERLRATGTAHLIAVSGAHVMLFLALPYFVLRNLRRRWRLPLLAILVLAYTLLTGGASPVRRAALLVAAQLACEGWNRPHRGFEALCWTAVIELVISPAQIIDLSFLLSYLAVAGLLVGLINAPAPSSWRRRLLLSLRMGLGACAATLPLLHHHFGSFSPHTLWLSPLGSPMLALSMALGYTAIAIQSGTLAWCAAQPLAAFDQILFYADQLAGTPIGLAEVPLSGSLALSAAVLTALAGLWRVAIAACSLTVVAWCSSWMEGWLFDAEAPRPIAFIEALDVGHGTCVLIGDDRGRAVLFDAGSQHAPKAAARALASRFAHHGITEIVAAVISHRDDDHRNLLRFSADLPEPRIRIGPTGCPEIDQELIEGSLHLQVGDLSLTIHAPRARPTAAPNDRSLWLEVEVGSHRFVLCGDPDWLGLAEILEELPHGCDVLLWPHHGRTRAGTRALVERAAPRRIWISDEVERDLDGGAGKIPVFDTTRCGALLWTLSADGTVRWQQARVRIPSPTSRPLVLPD